MRTFLTKAGQNDQPLHLLANKSLYIPKRALKGRAMHMELDNSRRSICLVPELY